MTGVQNCVKGWCTKNNVKVELMNDWMNSISELIDEKIKQLKCKNYHKVTEKLKNDNVLKALKLLQ